jgi:hypothetical protein
LHQSKRAGDGAAKAGDPLPLDEPFFFFFCVCEQPVWTQKKKGSLNGNADRHRPFFVLCRCRGSMSVGVAVE